MPRTNLYSEVALNKTHGPWIPNNTFKEKNWAPWLQHRKLRFYRENTIPWPIHTTLSFSPLFTNFSCNLEKKDFPLWVAYHQLYLHKSTLLSEEMHLMPKAPLLFSMHTVNHFTRCIFFTSAPPLQGDSFEFSLAPIWLPSNIKQRQN